MIDNFLLGFFLLVLLVGWVMGLSAWTVLIALGAFVCGFAYGGGVWRIS